jgi:predicted Fe-Mo cluster-binding NifX family protein
MKIAIPLFGSRVSPRFGCESEILIVEIEAGKEINRLSSTLIRNGVEDEYCGKKVLPSLCGREYPISTEGARGQIHDGSQHDVGD